MSMLTDAQKIAYQHKLEKNWNITDLRFELDKIREELNEAQKALDEDDSNAFLEELADIAIYLLGAAEIAGGDLGDEINRKQKIVSARTYSNSSRVYQNIFLLHQSVDVSKNSSYVILDGNYIARKDYYCITPNKQVFYINHVDRIEHKSVLDITVLSKSDADEVIQQFADNNLSGK